MKTSKSKIIFIYNNNIKRLKYKNTSLRKSVYVNEYCIIIIIIFFNYIHDKIFQSLIFYGNIS